ncbi:MAG: heme exporter protein CcmB [Acidimicrobiia bacterium]
MNVFQEAALVARKDLRIEARSRVTMTQILPFGGIVLLLFAFALDQKKILRQVAPGLFWVCVLLAALLAVSRSFGIEQQHGARDGLRLSGLDGAAVFLGKAGAIGIELLALELVLGIGVVVLYGITLDSIGILMLSAVAATVSVAATGTLYGVLAAGLRVRETLVPLLLLPVAAPVMFGATRAFELALHLHRHSHVADAWPWVGMLTLFAVIYASAGMLAFPTLLEES